MKIKRLIALCAFFSFVVSANAVKVVFRLDDPTIQYDSVHFRVLQLFVDKGVPLSIATIPCSKTENAYEVTDSVYWSYMNSPNIEIALHGLTHENINNHGEFGPLSAEETNRRFHKGKDVLQKHFSKSINTFIPPFNATNLSFPDNLDKNGIHIVSADLFQEVPACGNIQYYPETLGHLMERKGIWNAAKESITNCHERGAICVIMFHAYDLKDSVAWSQLESLLDLCKNDERVELFTFSSLYESGENSNWLRYRANQLSSGLSKLILSTGVLHSTWLCLTVHAANALFYLIFAIIGMVIILFHSHSRREKRWLVVSTILFGLFAFCAAWLHWLSPLKLLFVTILINISPVIYASLLRKRQ